MDEYQLRRLPQKRGVCSIDDLCYILFFHWAFNKNVYIDEHQRTYVSAGLLMASYFGCRPVSMFDTRINSQHGATAYKSINNLVASRSSKYESDKVKGYSPKDGQGLQDFVTSPDTPDDHLDVDEAMSSEESDSDSGIDDETEDKSDFRCLLWRHYRFRNCS